MTLHECNTPTQLTQILTSAYKIDPFTSKADLFEGLESHHNV